MYDKCERYFEDKSVPDASIDDIDMEMVQSYIEKIGYSKTPLEYLKENKSFVKIKNGKEIISGAVILLFGKNPQIYFPRARIRFIRFEGTEEKVGTEMNVIKDVMFEETILKMIQDCIAYLDTCLDVMSMRIDGKDDSVIRINENDELIDPRPCIIYYLKAFYLKKYKIFSCIEQIYKARPNEKCDPDIREASLEEKILYLVSLETRQIRYRKQVEIPFIKQFQKNQLEYRMSEILNKDDDAQIFCSLGFVDETGKRLFDAIGFADVVKEDTIFNLYYTEQFSHENYLITACHMVALGKDKGFLWNLYNNQMCCIKIPDKHKFMDAVAVAMTKGKLKKYYGDIL